MAQNRQKNQMSSQAVAYWLCAILCTLAGAILPAVIREVAFEPSLRDSSDGLLTDEATVAHYGVLTVIIIIAYIAARLIPWAMALYFGSVGREAQRLFNVQVMHQRSAEAKCEILESARAGKAPPPFFLYLRPFYADELTVDNPRVSSIPYLPSHYYAGSVSWESLFASRVERVGRLVSLGTVSDSLSADRIESDESTWVSDFVLLASLAECVFIWPSTRAGTRWEIKWLLHHDLLPKCVFVIGDGHDQFMELCGDTWEYIRAFLLAEGFAPPVRRGAIFTADSGPRLARPLQVQRRRSGRTITDFISMSRAGEFALRWKLWQFAQAEQQTSRENWTPDELNLFLPCVICGRALEDVDCRVCEQQVSTDTDTDTLLSAVGDHGPPSFNSLGQV